MCSSTSSFLVPALSLPLDCQDPALVARITTRVTIPHTIGPLLLPLRWSLYPPLLSPTDWDPLDRLFSPLSALRLCFHLSTTHPPMPRIFKLPTQYLNPTHPSSAPTQDLNKSPVEMILIMMIINRKHPLILRQPSKILTFIIQALMAETLLGEAESRAISHAKLLLSMLDFETAKGIMEEVVLKEEDVRRRVGGYFQ